MKTYDQIVRSVYGSSRTSFWSGFAGALNLFGTARKASTRRPYRRSAAQALTEDWAAVSQDFERALKRAVAR